ncbi:hypothetical protein A0U95_09135 [Pseudomonas brassicacearum]|uniref:DUF2790 domain-containing protein n=1 Tax=Pseudomonas TaxID=286 RepID=UPI000859AC56|nr:MULTISPECIES: DUF2790 domain-containing protein [Pseudomonas]AOS38918.1 hypothetical protein A0U95_09135 [Pseudomonas brassicacearum]
MKTLDALLAVSILSLSSLALAEGGGDRVYGQMIQNNQLAMARYAAENGKAVAEIVHYEYGMNLDVKKVVSITPANKGCGVGPSRMTYEDSNGKLNTVEYRLLSDNCPNGG